MTIQVAVGIVQNKKGRILISQRRKGTDLAGLWEFPGGKFEKGETDFTALKRELLEEVGLDILSADKILEIPPTESNIKVTLHIMWVRDYTGEADGLEGQTIKWVKPEQLSDYEFPPANDGVLNSIKTYAKRGFFSKNPIQSVH